MLVDIGSVWNIRDSESSISLRSSEDFRELTTEKVRRSDAVWYDDEFECGVK